MTSHLVTIVILVLQTTELCGFKVNQEEGQNPVSQHCTPTYPTIQLQAVTSSCASSASVLAYVGGQYGPANLCRDFGSLSAGCISALQGLSSIGICRGGQSAFYGILAYCHVPKSCSDLVATQGCPPTSQPLPDFTDVQCGDRCNAATCCTPPEVSITYPSTTTTTTRPPVPNGKGCYTIADRGLCCQYSDGRSDDLTYAGQPCVPAVSGKAYNFGQICEPECFVYGTCAPSPQNNVGGCLTTSTTTPSPYTPLPQGVGCYTISDPVTCCRSSDGRSDNPVYGGQRCIPAKPGSTYPFGQVCDVECYALGTCGSSSQAAVVGDCTTILGNR